MGVLKYISKAWKTHEAPDVQKERLIQWRRQPVTLRIANPTRLDRARALGYKAKLGVLLVRQKVDRGGHTRPSWSGGRRSRNMSPRLNLRKNYQMIAEERAAKKYVNCEVLNSYFVGKDGISYWFEIILVDRTHPSVSADKNFSWIADKRGRAARGLTSAGRKIRGLRQKGKGVEKARPSRRANLRRL
ncbi:50S ribosomal protein L15e [Candidatus Woesearchaeota archaeon CG10_big_fil_rev_8_21_14_0_10_37_12]|nr:MAG: 50S ribosomal protein L15e [Candidatus Woesearchaeota archaeon CG10_big_fil_rev_8_21_14_0_10_37_12]